MDSIPASRLLGIESPLRSGMWIRRVSGGAGLAQWMEFHSPFSEASLKGLGGAGMAAGWEYPEGWISQKKPTPGLNPAVCSVGKTPLGRWEWRQVQAGTGKIQENSTVSQKFLDLFLFQEKKIIFPPFLPFPPFSGTWEDQKIPWSHLPNFSRRNKPLATPLPKISLQKFLGMTQNCSLLPETHPKKPGLCLDISSWA